MKKLTNYLFLFLIVCTSCKVTEQKATRYLNDHPAFGSDYCEKKYPVKDSIAIRPDSIGYENAIINLLIYADSIVSAIAQKDAEIDGLKNEITRIVKKGEYTEAAMQDLLKKASNIKRVDTADLRRSWEKEFRKTVPVCQDSLIIKESTAKVERISLENGALRADATRLNAKLSAIAEERDELKDRIRGKILIPWWWLAIAGAVLGTWIVVRIKAGALKNILSLKK